MDGVVPTAKKIENPQMSLRTNGANFFDDYILQDELGSGSYSVCRLAKHRTTGQQYAVKVSWFVYDKV